MVQLDYDNDTFIYTQKILFYLKDALSENNLTSTDMLFIFTRAPFCKFVKTTIQHVRTSIMLKYLDLDKNFGIL